MQRLLVPIVFAAALGACVASNGDEGIFITKNVAPGAGCTFTGAADEQFLAHGTYALGAPAPYQFHPQMQSRITAETGQEDARTILLRGARVDLEFADTTLFTAAELATLKTSGATHFKSLFSAPLLPNGGITDGSFDLIPVALGDAVTAKAGAGFRTEVIAKVVVFGDMSGDEVTSQEFQFPVTLCADCVTNLLTSPAGAPLACPVPDGTTVSPGNECNPFQDGTVDCCLQTDGTALCPAPIAPPVP